MNELRVKVEGGTLVATKIADEHYPGIDVEFIPDSESDDDPLTRPRVLFEKPKGEALAVMVWADKASEDYSDKIAFS